MEMFTLKRSTSAWLACCRACGHEQALPTPAPDAQTGGAAADTGINIRCERCPSEEAYFALPESSVQTSADSGVA